MSLQRFLAIAHKESLHLVRDPRSLGMGIFIPMMMLFLYGYALTLDVDRVPMMIWDQSQSVASRELISRFQGSRYFSLTRFVQSYREIEQAIDNSQTLTALIIPIDFAKYVVSGQPTRVQFIVDGSDSNTATLATGYAQSVMLTFSQHLAIKAISKAGGITLTPPLDVRPRIWFNPDLESKNYIIPGLIAVIMMVISALLTSLTIAREWETGTMEQLISTPVKPVELILGKLIPYFGIGFLDVILAVLMGEFLFKVPLRGNIALLFGLASIFLVGSLSMGLFISIATKSQLVSNQLAMVLTYLPSFLLSGFIFAIRNMPRALRVITYLVPARYFIAIIKGIYLKGLGLETLALEAGLLTLFALITVTLSIKKFKKRLE